MLYTFQGKIIYLCRKYDTGDRYYKSVSERVERIEYGDSSSSFFVPPKSVQEKHEKLWILIGGNAALALEWYDFCAAVQQTYPHYSFLLYEYDGYGFNTKSTPSPESIDRSMKQLYETFSNNRKIPPEINLLGHSLGSAAVLRFAAANNKKVNIKKTILISPFTSMLDMARVVLGPLPFIETLLRHRWNNIESMKMLQQSKASIPKIFITHGTRDGIVPFDQGKELYQAALSNGIHSVEFLPVEDANHNDIISRGFRDILDMMEQHDEDDSCVVDMDA